MSLGSPLLQKLGDLIESASVHASSVLACASSRRVARAALTSTHSSRTSSSDGGGEHLPSPPSARACARACARALTATPTVTRTRTRTRTPSAGSRRPSSIEGIAQHEGIALDRQRRRSEQHAMRTTASRSASPANTSPAAARRAMAHGTPSLANSSEAPLALRGEPDALVA